MAFGEPVQDKQGKKGESSGGSLRCFLMITICSKRRFLSNTARLGGSLVATKVVSHRLAVLKTICASKTLTNKFSFISILTVKPEFFQL